MKRLLMAMVLMPLMALADDIEEDAEIVNGIEWEFTISEGKASVVWVSKGEAVGAIEIPSVLGGCPVTSIGMSALAGCFELTSVTIPSSVTSIGIDAFAGCRKITTATIPARFRIAEVFPDSFGTLTNVTVLSSGGKICNRAFEDCRCLTSVTFSCDVEEIGESAFENCRRLESITIPATVKKIDAYAFYGCGRLKTVNYLGEKPEIEGAAFMGTGVGQPPSADVVNVVVSNVIVQYVFNSVQPEFAIPATSDTGFVNIITEVKGNNVAIPATWGKTSLMDTDWTEVQDGHEAEYNFFKVSVEMR